jgi:glycosyltransferase involved in cell wall biosynthesis
MFDIFHPTYYDPYFLELIEKPYVLTVYDMIHEIYSEYFSPSDTVIKNKRILCEKADKIIAISQSTKNDLIDIFKLPEDKIYAIPLASNFNDVIPQKPSGTEALSDYILFVGLRSAYKNFYFSVIALSEILKNDKKLSLVCTGHEFSNEEINFFKNLKIENQVKHIYLQNDNELAWVYQHARLFIFPSLYEGFGLPLLEAFAKNCPVICSTSGSLPEVGGDAVIYFQPKNINEIQEAAHKAIYDNEVREELISKGQKQLSKFSWDKCRSQTIDVYNTVYIN